jgi:hypothetical protein
MAYAHKIVAGGRFRVSERPAEAIIETVLHGIIVRRESRS